MGAEGMMKNQFKVMFPFNWKWSILVGTSRIFYIILAEKWIFHIYGEVVEPKIRTNGYFQDICFKRRYKNLHRRVCTAVGFSSTDESL